MIYVFHCPNCNDMEEFILPVKDLERARAGARCVQCGIPALLDISGGNLAFMRSPFPKGFSEHVSKDGHYIRDKHEARDVAAENGFTSKYVENMR